MLRLLKWMGLGNLTKHDGIDIMNRDKCYACEQKCHRPWCPYTEEKDETNDDSNSDDSSKLLDDDSRQEV